MRVGFTARIDELSLLLKWIELVSHMLLRTSRCATWNKLTLDVVMAVMGSHLVVRMMLVRIMLSVIFIISRLETKLVVYLEHLMFKVNLYY